MVRSPGARKTLLAHAVPGILAEMSIEESLDLTCIYSVAAQLPDGTPMITLPFARRITRFHRHGWWVGVTFKQLIILPDVLRNFENFTRCDCIKLKHFIVTRNDQSRVDLFSSCARSSEIKLWQRNSPWLFS